MDAKSAQLKTGNGYCFCTWYIQRYQYINTITVYFVLAWVVTKIVPGEDLNEKYKPRNLDRNLINRAPSIALQEAQEEIQNIGHMTFSMLKNVNEYDDKKKETSCINTRL